MDDLLLAGLIVACGLLVGNEFGTKLVVHPALARLGVRDNILADRAINRGEARWVPFLMIAATALGFACSIALEGAPATLALAAALCLTVTIAITLIGNMPLNVKVLSATEDMPEAQWRALRRRWDRLHSVRIVLDAAALALVAVAAVS